MKQKYHTILRQDLACVDYVHEEFLQFVEFVAEMPPAVSLLKKGKKTIKTFYKLLAVCERNISTHKHYHVLFLVREGEYTSPIFVKSFLPKKFKKKMK